MKYDFSSLRGQNVLVTGCSGAIGKAIAEGFAACGANVFAWGHHKLDYDLQEVMFQTVELTAIKDVDNAISLLPDRIHTFVNCAGVTYGENSEKYPWEQWEKTLKVNLSVPFTLSQKIFPKMCSYGSGSIINITSINAEQGFPNNPAYVSSKGGLKMLSKALARDWAEYGIRVNNVGPGYTRTKMTKRSWNDLESRKQKLDRMMLRRWAEPEDIVGIVLFLASDMASYITGQDIYVDGGWLTKGI